ncbi:MAG: tetratricopeptide repeat protein [Lachnospiraceae bacterium]|nr:tetratricopeptide repeat protein [Lachnospiraceae bacterium]
MEKCFYCKSPISEEQDRCPSCGASQKAYRMIMASSEMAYNEGLERACEHDLSRAIESLSRAVRFNKRNIKARNLLGLVYMEYGEPVLALREWVIAKNFAPDDELSDRYLNSVSQDVGLFDRIDTATRRFNTALKYCQSGSTDLALIEIKRVIHDNPGMVKARQLTALLYINDKQYSKAYNELKEAEKVDWNNPLTARYIKEVKKHLVPEKKHREKKVRRQTIEYNDGHDVVMIPRQTFIEALDNSKSGLFNILLGIAIGVLCFIFVVTPTIRIRENEKARTALITANNKAASSKSDAATLKKQVDELKSQLDRYEGQSDVKGSYESLLESYSKSQDEDYDSASNDLSDVNQDLLDKNGKALYKTVSDTVDQKVCEKKYTEGRQALARHDYKAAIEAFSQVVKLDDSYENGDALYRLAEAYEDNGDKDNAIKYYNKVVDKYADSYKGRSSARKIQTLQSSEGE